MKLLTVLLVGCFSLPAFAASGPHTVTGKVTTFNEQYVTIEVQGHLLEFARKRIKDQSQIRQGAIVKVSLD